MYMNNLKIVVTLLVLIAVVAIGLNVILKTDTVPKVESSIPYVEDVTVPFYSSNGGEK